MDDHSADHPPTFSREWRSEPVKDTHRAPARGLRFYVSRLTFQLSRINWPLLLGSLIILFIAIAATVGPKLAPHDPMEENAIIKIGGEWKIPPFAAFTPGYPLGSDEFGRDLLSRLLWAVRPTMVMVLIVAAVRLALGTAIGLTSGWFTGWIGRALDAAIAAALSVPVLMVALGAIAAVGIETGIWAFIIGLSINGWIETARLVREQTRIVKNQLFIEAARALGASSPQILLGHVLRQIMPMVWMLFAFEISGTLMVTAALGFLGYYIGGDVWVVVTDTTARRISGAPELGQMLATEAQSVRLNDLPWGMIAVGGVISITVLGFNLLGRGLRGRLSLKRISQRTILRRTQEAINTKLVEPASLWIDRKVQQPLRTRSRPLAAAGLLTLILGSSLIIAWRLHILDQEMPDELVALEGPLWATERRDSQGTLWSQTADPVEPEVQWIFVDPALSTGTNPAGFSGGPAVSEAGMVYVASKGGRLYALSPDGDIRWQVSLPDASVGTPALDAEGRIYVTDKAGNLSTFAPTGDLQWRFVAETDDFATSGPVVAPSGIIYYMLRGSTVQAVSSTGQELWKTQALYNPIFSPPRLSADGQWVFVKNVILDAQDGSLQELETPVDVDQYIMGADGQNYLQSGNEIFQWRSTKSGIETISSTTWDYRQFTVRAAGGPTDAGVTPKQLVWLLYASNKEDTRIVWIDRGGRTKGNAHLPQRETRVIAVDRDGITYACGWDRTFQTECMALKPDSGEPIWQMHLNQSSQYNQVAQAVASRLDESNAKINGGALAPSRLYVTKEEGLLFAIGAGQHLEIADQGTTQDVEETVEQPTVTLGPNSEKVAWTLKDPAGFSSGPMVSDDGTVYIASQGNKLYALDPAGNTLWEATLPTASVGVPALSLAGDIYIADKEGNLTAFTPDGNLRWRFQPPESKSSTVGPLVGSGGTIYYTVGGNIQAVSPTGEGLWQTPYRTFRNYTPLQLSPTGEQLFFADDVFDAQDGTLLELESTVDVDQFIAGNDGQTYVRSKHTLMQWQLRDSSIEIVQSAQWNYEGLVYSEGAPSDAGVTKDGTIWLMYTTPWGSSTLIAWIDPTGQMLGTASPKDRFSAGQIIGVLDQDAKTFVCGLKDRPQGYSPTTVQCNAFVTESEEPVWQVELEKSKDLAGGALAPGRMYLATVEGVLYAIGEGQPLAVATQNTVSSGPASATGEVITPPPEEIAWVFKDPTGFSGGPAAAADGTIYIASKNNIFYALDPAGNTLWEAVLPAAPVGAPILSATGDIYQADKAGNLSCFAPDGSLRWRFEPTESKPPSVGPLVAPDGTIFYTVGSSVQAVSPNGEGLWQTRAKTFRTLIPLQLSATEGLLFFADDIFNIQDGTRLELESLVNADQYIAGKDGQLYLRDGNTVIQWQLKGSSVEIIQNAQWDHENFSNTPPVSAGVTQEGVIWLAYTKWRGGMVWLDTTGQVLGISFYRLYEGQLIKVLDRDATAYVCGEENPGSSRSRPQCKAIAPGSEEPIWQVELKIGEDGTLGEIKGGVLVPGRLYVATEGGFLFAIGERLSTPQPTPSEPTEETEAPLSATPPPQLEEEGEEQEPLPVTPQATPTIIPSDWVIAGDTLTYTLPVVNSGPSDAPDVVVTNVLPSGVSLVSATSSQGTGCIELAGIAVCDLGNLANGASATITIVVKVDPQALTAGTITNTAIVASQAADSTTIDNRVDQSATIQSPADLMITSFDVPNPVVAGRTATYTLAISNNGPGDATSAVVSSTLPISTTFIAATSSQGPGCIELTGNVICNLDRLIDGASATVTIIVAIDPSAKGIIIHSSRVVANEPDPAPANNAIDVETNVSAEADLTITR